MWNQDMVEAAIKSNDVERFDDEVTISEKASPTGKEAKRAFINYRALTATGMAAMCGGKYDPMKPSPKKGEKDERTDVEKEYGACDYFNYGYDLELRQKARTALLSELEGPEKSVRKLVLMLLAAENTEEDVRDTVINSPKFKGVDGLENMVESALKSVPKK